MSKGFGYPGSTDFGSSAMPGDGHPGSFEPGEKPGHGCFFYGCITALVLLLLAAIASYVAFRFVRGVFREYVATYTDDAPRPLPVVNVPKEQQEALVKREQEFRRRIVDPPGPGEPRTLTDEERTLVLTTEELNALIEREPATRGKFYVDIKDGELKAQVSIPLEGIPILKGRYLNADARIMVSLDDGDPVIQLRDVRVKGAPLPDSLRQGVERLNLAAPEPDQDSGVEPKPKRRPLARKFERIEVKEGTLTIVARKETEGPGQPVGVDPEAKEAGQGKDSTPPARP